jgi:hypothetical protein
MRGVATLTTAVVALFAAIAVAQPSASALAPVTERAQPAARFLDSIGMNVHLSYRDTGYGDARRVATLLTRLGVRHVRDGMTLDRPDVCKSDRMLAADGIRFTVITQANPTAGQLTSWATCAGPAIEAFEGLNEYDISHPASDGDWVATVRESQRDLYRATKETPRLAALPVIGPSLTSEAAFDAVGDLSANLDEGNIHNYFSNHEPETPGWGLGGYGSIGFNVRIARSVDGAKPIASTETGYGTDRADHTVDDAAQATYLPRLFLEQFASGIRRTFTYELIDEGGAPYGHYGIVNADLSPKPAYIALASLIGALSDTQPAINPGTLSYALDAGADVHHVLLQKHDGSYVLALWVAAASYDASARDTRPVPPQPVTVRLAMPLRSAAIESYGDDWRLHRTPLPASAPLRLDISDRVTLLELMPAS